MTYLGLTAQEAEKREHVTQLRERGWGPYFLVGQLHIEFRVSRPVRVCLPRIPPQRFLRDKVSGKAVGHGNTEDQGNLQGADPQTWRGVLKPEMSGNVFSQEKKKKKKEKC